MRLWSIHPQYLDAKGLVGLWREALLAQKVLQGDTSGYKNHPQLTRFKSTANPVGSVADYLRHVADEADKRGYNFNRDKIVNERCGGRIAVTDKQVEYEFTHLLNKLKQRSHELYLRLSSEIEEIEVHPQFAKIRGNVEPWEVT
ncbi:DNA-(Apurinic or apyrimidinic site) lyase / pyrimidine dimer DNA glycosylase [Desulfamplus magnetovallimortis]|uniref:DNA-(Apurinic or apyrimidinic site) lyase / pyrimidine dimer DNA glycosylase n=1 Tax=Desulfamplus magnetovallimortis TaxID=1246637 RepID=A0A1W1H5U1_9BACT|nr:pyrimidine dimer DNA glycosylase/endonuclease V [Desulfamplus magnetovallimortis]SLM27849.1 DNA-(Apurinic or apyrimidinic site) lyase / pyrimidine dimer DNA glycosylase [Desulfamplus magnetovallimortis]